MGTMLGADLMLWVETAVADTYILVGGQKPLSFARSASSLPTGTKATYPYVTSRAGAISIKIGCDGLIDLPDASFELLQTKFTAGAAVKVQIRKNGVDGLDADAVFEGSVAIIDLPYDAPEDNLVSYKLSLEPAAAPILDELA